MLDRHYSPRARLLLVPAREAGIDRLVRTGGWTDGWRVGRQRISRATRAPRGCRPRRRSTRAGCTTRFTRFDDAGCDVIVVERVPAGDEWAGVRDRLARAAVNDSRE